MLASVVIIVTLSTFSTAFADTLIVLNKAEATASLIELSTAKTSRLIRTGEGPHEVVVSPDGKTGVISNYGSSGPGSNLTVFDVASAKVTATIELMKFKKPHGISWIKGTGNVLVTSESEKAVVIVDVSKKEIVASIATGQETSHMLATDPNSNLAFVANIDSGTVSVLDLKHKIKIKDIPTGEGAEGLAVNPERNELWVTNRGSNTISVIDIKSLTVIETLDAGTFPIRVKFTLDHNKALVTNAKSGDLYIFDAKTRNLLSKIKFPFNEKETSGRMFGNFKGTSVPIGIALDPKRNRAYIAHANQDSISIFDLSELKLIGTLTAGKEPDGMAYSIVSVLSYSEAYWPHCTYHWLGAK